MAEIPSIVVQIIHIEGPKKGQIEEFAGHEIVIGRHPDCQVRFPADLNMISRRHASIIREGNRFKLVDASANGTVVNGKQVKEAMLKDGDVIAIAQGGPKFSFLTKVGATVAAPAPTPPAPPAPPVQPVQPPPAPPVQPAQPQTPGVPPVQQPAPPPQAPVQPPPVQPQVPVAPPPVQEPMATPQPPPAAPIQPPPVQPQVSSPPAPPGPKVKAPLIIQFGPTLQSFKEVPVTIGTQPGCEYILNHPGILGLHAQIWFDQGNYWIKDLTGQNAVTVHGTAVGNGMALQPATQVSFSPQGPLFQFLGNGRLAEVETAQAPPPPPPVEPQGISMTPNLPKGAGLKPSLGKIAGKTKSVLDKYLKR